MSVSGVDGGGIAEETIMGGEDDTEDATQVTLGLRIQPFISPLDGPCAYYPSGTF